MILSHSVTLQVTLGSLDNLSELFPEPAESCQSPAETGQRSTRLEITLVGKVGMPFAFLLLEVSVLFRPQKAPVNAQAEVCLMAVCSEQLT